MGAKRMGPPHDLVLALQEHLQLQLFVETGTFRGETAAWAATRFARVLTIELSSAYHAKAVERFKAQPGVRPLRGRSPEVLRQIGADLCAPALFWLDAHWSGLDTAGQDSECPLLEEVGVIDATAPGHVILVDDARLFCAPPPRPHRAEQWPDLAAIVTALVAGGRRYVALFEDVFIAVPVTEREFLTGWLQDAATAGWANEGSPAWWRRLKP